MTELASRSSGAPMMATARFVATDATMELSAAALEAMALRLPSTGDPVDERVDYFLTATSWSGVPRVLEPHKCAELRWCNLSGLPSPVVPHELRVLESLRGGSVQPILVHGFG